MMTPGIHILSADQYHADPAPEPSLSSSIAQILLEKSPLHAWLSHPRLNRQYQRTPDSRFDLGSAAHAMLLERRTDNIVIVEANDWRTKAAKEQRDLATAAGKYAVLARQYREVESMVLTARTYIDTTELSGILEYGAAEQSVLWQDGDVWCRARPDMLSKTARVCLDYKTTEDASPAMFARQISRLGYDLQAEWYLRGLKAVDSAAWQFVFLVQEIYEPYACSLISLSNAYRAVGQAKVTRALNLWVKCLSEDRWPGYESRILYAEPRPWDLAMAEELEADGTEDDEP
jgi:hypothetical protein